MAVTAGDAAPDFSLPGVDGGERRTFTLGEFAGRPVVLAFYPGDNTPVCTRQLTTYTADIEQFTDLALGIAEQALVLRGGKTRYSGPPQALIDDKALLDAAYFGTDAAGRGAHVGVG